MRKGDTTNTMNSNTNNNLLSTSIISGEFINSSFNNCNSNNETGSNQNLQNLVYNTKITEDLNESNLGIGDQDEEESIAYLGSHDNQEFTTELIKEEQESSYQTQTLKKSQFLKNQNNRSFDNRASEKDS